MIFSWDSDTDDEARAGDRETGKKLAEYIVQNKQGRGNEMSMGLTQMNSILSSQNALKSMVALNATKTSMNGSSRVMASEIEQDKGRGVDTAKKEEELADMKERIQSIGESLEGSMTKLNESLEADSEKIREEEAEKARQAKKAEEKTGTSKMEQSGITEPVDTVEISHEGKVVADGIPVNTASDSTAVLQANTSSTGKAVDIKV